MRRAQQCILHCVCVCLVDCALCRRSPCVDCFADQQCLSHTHTPQHGRLSNSWPRHQLSSLRARTPSVSWPRTVGYVGVRHGIFFAAPCAPSCPYFPDEPCSFFFPHDMCLSQLTPCTRRMHIDSAAACQLVNDCLVFADQLCASQHRAHHQQAHQ
jgi:hypothetical protein